jgi:hypothetical protein
MPLAEHSKPVAATRPSNPTTHFDSTITRPLVLSTIAD